MSRPHDRASTIQAARRVLAADLACPESALVEEGVCVTPFELRPGRRGFPPPAKPMVILTMGAGVVVSCHPERVDWLRATLGGRSRDEIFSVSTMLELAAYVARDGQTLRGRANVFLCSPETFRAPVEPATAAIELIVGADVTRLYRHEGFGNALSYRPDHPRPDVAAVVASREGVVLGIAGMSADSEVMWQIGIDVVPSARGAGLGRALVGRLTELAFRQGKIPYYSAAVSNIRSNALAVSLGYWPAWSEMYARDRSE
jgi:GNAT superfamily N-acetyltransferase